MISRLLQSVVLPVHVSDFERSYLKRLNRIALWFFVAHLPAFMLIALINGQSVLQAVVLTSLVLAGPVLAQRAFESPRSVSLVYGFSSMLMGGVLVHLGQGPAQIEMHFYFFALLAMLAVFANPMAIIVAAITVALHHILLWMYLPQSVFNYAAPLWVVLVHAAFVVLESVATCFIARSFFDNVIGLEAIVQARTAELDARNRDMRLVMDTVDQGLLMADRNLVMSNEKSTVLGRWFGPAANGQNLVDYLRQHDQNLAQRLSVGWDQVLADFLPLELALDQLPRHFAIDDRHFELSYTPVLDQEQSFTQALVVVNDVTAARQRERVEAEQRDVIQLLGRVAKDRVGVSEFMSEARGLVTAIEDPNLEDRVVMRRLVHTLKGNCMIFGVQTVATLCHELESRMGESGAIATPAERSALRAAWTHVQNTLDMLLGRQGERIEIDETEYAALLAAVTRGEKSDALRERVRALKLEPSARRLQRSAEQAQAIAKRLNKPNLHVVIEDNGVRLDADQWSSFWSAFVHVLRNAVDHGIELPEERRSVGKAPEGSITLRTQVSNEWFSIMLSDDGRGIDWSAVAAKAQRHGLPHATQADLVEALFADGVSTRDEVNEFSGRGIGMGVIREACRSRGGQILVESQTGSRTTMEFRFPRAAVAESIQLRRAS
jgi:HPt (histidine-containing phosphotransfer) domain-containing protein